MHIITMIATLIAPIFGAWIATQFNWAGIFIFLLLYSILCLIWTKCSIEARPPTNLPTSLLNNYGAVLKNRHAIGLILCNSFSFGGMFAYITASSFVFIHHYGFSPQQYAYLFGFNIFSIIVFTSINSRALKYYSAYHLLKIMALISCCAGIYLAVITLFNFESAAWLIAGLAVFVGVTGSIGANSLANLLKLLPQQAGTASGLAVATQFAIGAIMSWLVSLLFDGTHPSAMNYVVCLGACLCIISLSLTRGMKQD